MEKYHSSGIEEGKIYSSGNRGLSRNENLLFFFQNAYFLYSTKFFYFKHIFLFAIMVLVKNLESRIHKGLYECIKTRRSGCE